VTEKTFFERLYLFLGLRKFAPWVNCPYAPTTPTIHCTTISRFLCNFFPRTAPHFFGNDDYSPSIFVSRLLRSLWYPLYQIVGASREGTEILVSGLSPFELCVNCPCAPTPPLFTVQLYLDFCAIFFGCGMIFFVST